jgi:hypothetical protein
VSSAYVEEAHPLQDGSVVLLGLAQQGGLLILRLELMSALRAIMFTILLASPFESLNLEDDLQRA